MFPVKQIAHVAIAKTYTWRDVKKEKQMRSKLFRGMLSTRKGEVSFSYLYKHKYKIFICCAKELRHSFAMKFGRRTFYLLGRKRRKMLCFQEEQKGEGCIVKFQKISIPLPRREFQIRTLHLSGISIQFKRKIPPTPPEFQKAFFTPPAPLEKFC